MKRQCPFKPKINSYDIKRNIEDLFEWKIKVDKNKENAKKIFQINNDEKIGQILNYKPEYDYYKNKRFLEQFNRKNRMEQKNNLYSSESIYSQDDKNEDVWPIDLYQKL